MMFYPLFDQRITKSLNHLFPLGSSVTLALGWFELSVSFWPVIDMITNRQLSLTFDVVDFFGPSKVKGLCYSVWLRYGYKDIFAENHVRFGA